LTGLPGVGKTTVLQRVIDELNGRSFKVGGMMTREVRRDMARVGFEIEDLSTKRKGWLAHVNQPHGPQIGKYKVNLRDLEEVGAKAILNAVQQADIIAIDEIGPMELFSASFKDSVVKAVKSGKAVLGTIHYRVRDPFVTTMKENRDVEVIEVTLKNREVLPRAIADRIAQIVMSKFQSNSY